MIDTDTIASDGNLAKYWIRWALNTGLLSIVWSDQYLDEGIRYARRAWRRALDT